MADTAADARLGPAELVYVEKVRQAMRRMSSREPEPENIRQAVQAVRDLSTFDVEVPTASRRREFELVKTGIKRMSVWYMRYLAGQLNAFGTSVTRMGDALVARTEKLESTSDDLVARVGAAEERLARLEAASGGRNSGDRTSADRTSGDRTSGGDTSGSDASSGGNPSGTGEPDGPGGPSNGGPSNGKPSGPGTGPGGSQGGSAAAPVAPSNRRPTTGNRGGSNRPRNNRRKGGSS